MSMDYSKIQTPCYVYDADLLEETVALAHNEALKYGYHIHYALKANYQDVVLDTMIAHGFGADCVSGNEVKKALDAGFDPESILFAGVGKTDAEIHLALDHQIGCLNCESIEELIVIQEIAAQRNQVASVAIRVNPEVDAKTHAYITTGLAINKFGIQQSDVTKALDFIKSASHLNFKGFHFHVGSQITDLNVFKNLAIKVNEINEMAFSQGLSPEIIDLGGGLGINYAEPLEDAIPDFAGYFEIINQHLAPKERQEVHFEIGRALVGQCASILSKVLYVKQSGHKEFVIIDAGMTDLMRPALYQAEHAIHNVSSEATEVKPYDVVGPICETSDQFGKDISLPITKRGDYVMIRSVGAYGEVLASNYNLRDKAHVLWT